MLALLFFSLFVSFSDASDDHEFVLTLDSSNFSDAIGRHPFIVVEFYAPWCGHCQDLAPEYEKAASLLSKHDPPIVLAKVDANEEVNKDLASKYGITGFPTLKILRNGGKSIQEYKGPRDTEGIVDYLKKQTGPASSEIESEEDADIIIDDNKIVVVGIFNEFSGEEFENFTAIAEKLRADYDFGHTLDAGFLPRGDSSVKLPVIRLLKPFDEHFVDFQDFRLDALENFIEEVSTPIVTIFNPDSNNMPYILKFLSNTNDKVMLFVDFNSENFDSLKSKYSETAKNLKSKGLSFMMGDSKYNEGFIQYFGLKDAQLPVIIVQKQNAQKYLKANVEPDQLAPWLKAYMDGSVSLFIKSEPIPGINSDPVKVVVANNLEEVVLQPGKNVLIAFYSLWCGHCQKLSPILDEIAVSLGADEDVIIAKMDVGANDVPLDKFDVKELPTLYFSSAMGNLLKYDRERTKEDIIDFIQKHRDTVVYESGKDEL